MSKRRRKKEPDSTPQRLGKIPRRGAPLQPSVIRRVLVVTTSAAALAAALLFIARLVRLTDGPRELSNAKPPPATMPPPTFVGLTRPFSGGACSTTLSISLARRSS